MQRIQTVLVFLLLAILQASAQQATPLFPKGCYMGINSLMNRWVAQFTACEVYEKSSSDLYTEYLLYDSASGKKIEPVFAYSTGDTVYLYQAAYRSNNCYVKSLEVGRFLYFEDWYRKTSLASEATFGILGAMVLDAATRKNSVRASKAVDFTGIPGNSTCGIVLDTKAGVIRGVNAENFAAAFADFPGIVEKFNQSQRRLEDIRICVRELNKQY